MKTARMLDLALGLILLAAASEIASSHEIANRIFDGTKVRPGEMPFMAEIYHRNSSKWWHRCGGTIIDKQHILTAAHCFYGECTHELLESLPKSIQVQIGCLSSSHCNLSRYKVSEIMIYPYFSYKLKINDIAIIKLVDEIDMDADTIDSVNLERKEKSCCDNEKKDLTVAGWGLTEKGTFSEDLLKATHRSIPIEQCKEFGWNIDESMICAGNPGACSGDSGGPLLDGARTQVGIVSRGILRFGSCRDQYAEAFTKVARYIKWIDDCLFQGCDSIRIS